VGTRVESDAALEEAERSLNAMLGMAIRGAAVTAVGEGFTVSVGLVFEAAVAADSLTD
jgi:hypothetical protein